LAVCDGGATTKPSPLASFRAVSGVHGARFELHVPQGVEWSGWQGRRWSRGLALDNTCGAHFNGGSFRAAWAVGQPRRGAVLHRQGCQPWNRDALKLWRAV